MEEGRRTTLRSDFLFHWTGAKDIEKEYREGKSTVREDKTLSDEEREKKNEVLDKERRRNYVERLRTTLEPISQEDQRANGLWMTQNPEKIRGRGISEIKYEWPMISFTEIKLSDIREHTRRYGYLGFGFSRGFVIERYGAPVQYVTGKNRDIITSHFYYMYMRLRELQSSGAIQEARQEDRNIIRKLLGSVVTNTLFIKNMSESDYSESHDFRNLDEAEWRIPWTFPPHPRGENGIELVIDIPEDQRPPEAKVPFEQSDLKVIILPDEDTRQMVLKDCDIRKWLLKDPKYLPIIATVEECAQF